MDLTLTFDPVSSALFALVFAWLWALGARYDAISSRIDQIYTLMAEIEPRRKDALTK